MVFPFIDAERPDVDIGIAKGQGRLRDQMVAILGSDDMEPERDV